MACGGGSGGGTWRAWPGWSRSRWSWRCGRGWATIRRGCRRRNRCRWRVRRGVVGVPRSGHGVQQRSGALGRSAAVTGLRAARGSDRASGRGSTVERATGARAERAPGRSGRAVRPSQGPRSGLDRGESDSRKRGSGRRRQRRGGARVDLRLRQILPPRSSGCLKRVHLRIGLPSAGRTTCAADADAVVRKLARVGLSCGRWQRFRHTRRRSMATGRWRQCRHVDRPEHRARPSARRSPRRAGVRFSGGDGIQVPHGTHDQIAFNRAADAQRRVRRPAGRLRSSTVSP
jgi:hypothetical protein